MASGVFHDDFNHAHYISLVPVESLGHSWWCFRPSGQLITFHLKRPLEVQVVLVGEHICGYCGGGAGLEFVILIAGTVNAIEFTVNIFELGFPMATHLSGVVWTVRTNSERSKKIILIIFGCQWPRGTCSVGPCVLIAQSFCNGDKMPIIMITSINILGTLKLAKFSVWCALVNLNLEGGEWSMGGVCSILKESGGRLNDACEVVVPVNHKGTLARVRVNVVVSNGTFNQECHHRV